MDGIPVLLPDGSMNSKFAVFIVTYIMSVGWVVLQASEQLRASPLLLIPLWRSLPFLFLS